MTIQRGFLHFDLSALPSDAVISAATLRLNVTAKAGPDPLGLGLTVSRLNDTFVEGDGQTGVTWNTQPGVEASPTDTETMNEPVGYWFEMDVTAVAVAERQSADPNHAWLRVAPTDEVTFEDRWFGFAAKEESGGTNRPQLVINYEVPTPTLTPTPTPTPTVTDTPTPTVPPTPTPVEIGPPNDLTAPALDLTVATTVDQAAEFLYSGPDPVQTGVTPGAIEARRAAVIRGRVLDRDDLPLAGVTIEILDHPELGSTLTRANGVFDMTVNGGGVLTVTYAKPGFISVHRQVDVPWQEFAWAPDVVMIPYDTREAEVDLDGGAGFVAADGGEESDSDGTRQPRLLFPRGAEVTMVFADGSSAPVEMPMHVRTTEFTVGPNGPEAMPAELPPSSAYTYAAELSVVEADDNDAVRVEFSEPVIFYLENFITLPVGIPVPVGFYDRLEGVWVPSEDGRIVEIKSFDSFGRAELDTDGDGDADNDPALGITDDERAELTSDRYDIDQSLWRVAFTHFTPADLNYPTRPPADAVEPTEEPESDLPEDQLDCQNRSIIECQNQTLGESLEVVGTPFRLHYRSDRVPGRRSAYTIEIPLSAGSIPPSLKRIELGVQVAGRRFAMTVDPPEPDLSTSFTWDGRDVYGRLLQGSQAAIIRVAYVYDAVYAEPDQLGRSFARFSTTPMLNPSRREYTLQRTWRRTIGTWDARAVGLGGWTLDVQHAYEPTSAVVHFGNGRRLSTVLREHVIDTVAGTGQTGSFHAIGDGGPALEAHFDLPGGVAVEADGTYYVSDQNHFVIRKVSPDGTTTIVAGNENFGQPTPGLPATTQRLRLLYGLAVGGDGSVYFCDDGNNRVYRVDPDGVLRVVAGSGSFVFGGDGGPATSAGLSFPIDVALAPDGSIYIADRSHSRIRRVSPDGIIRTVAGAGNGDLGATGDGGPATAAEIGRPEGIALGPDGSLYIADQANHVVRRVGRDGIINTVAGQAGTPGFSVDGVPATQALLKNPSSLAVDRDGTLFIGDLSNRAVRRVAPDGILTTIAGQGFSGFAGDGGPAAAALLGTPAFASPSGLAVTPDGGLLLTDRGNNRIRKIFPPSREVALIPSEDGAQVYEFDFRGRHLRTRHGLTGATLLDLHYDETTHLLDFMTDGDGNVTQIERDGSGNPMAIIAPFGQRTDLTLDPNEFLASVRNPALETTGLEYTTEGLLTRLTDPRGKSSNFAYTAQGRLKRDTDAATGFVTLSRTEIPNGYQVTFSTKLGRTTTYEVVNDPVGDQLRANTDPTSLTTTTSIGADGVTVRFLPNGTGVSTTETGDPRFGMLAPVEESRTISTPLGLSLHVTTNRTSTPPTNPSDPLSFTQLSDAISINGRPFEWVFNAGPPATITATSAETRQTTLEIDPQGRITKSEVSGTSPVLHPIFRDYDGSGRLETVAHGPSLGDPGSRLTSFAYKPNGFLDTITDPTGRVVEFEYDDAGRVTSQTFQPGTADERVIGYDYDPNGNLAEITPPGQPTHSFVYTDVNLEKEYNPPPVSPADPKTTYVYNFDRQLEEIHRPDGQTIDFGYEPTGGRLESVTTSSATGPGDETRTYTYHPTTGNLQALSGPDADLTFGYDGSLLTNEQWNDGTVTSTVTRTYDDDFRVETLQVNFETAIIFGYDGDGLLTKAGALDPITRHPDYGFVTATTLGTVTDASTYSSFGELETYTASRSAGPVYSVQYTRDKLGRITSKTETIDGQGPTLTEYRYDPAGRLEEVEVNGDVTTYTYDANGNRLTREVNSVVQESGTHDDQDRLLTYGSATYSYNENGDLTQKTEGSAVTTYTYDALGNLRSVTLPDGVTTITYKVDGRNRRIGRIKDDGVTTVVQRFVYKDQLHPVAELDGSGNVVAEFVYATKANVPDYMIKNGITYRIVSDHLGSVRMVIDTSNGSIVQKIDYDGFGNATLMAGNWELQPFGFAGGLYESHAAIVRFGARDYEPQLGRWMAKEPLRFRSFGTNLYTYVLDDPINFVDTDGRIVAQLVGGTVGAAFGAVSAYNTGGDVLQSALVGFGAGALSTIPIPGLNPILSGIIVGGAAGGTGSLLNSLLSNSGDPGLAIPAAILSTLAGATGGSLGAILQNAGLLTTLGEDVLSNLLAGSSAGILDALLQYLAGLPAEPSQSLNRCE